jgi:hypothetical protein
MCCRARLPFESYRKLSNTEAIKPMTKQTIAAIILCAGAAIGLTTPAHAGDIVESTLSYDSPDGYDFVSTFPPSGSTTIGTYTFTPIALDSITGITISGAFGNGDNATTALSDYYLGFGGNETALEVAPCDDILDDCYSNENGPTGWTATLTQTQIADLATGLAGGSLDFTYTWDNNTEFAFPGYDQFVYASPATIDVSYTPEPATFLICFGGIAGIVALRRFRQL